MHGLAWSAPFFVMFELIRPWLPWLLAMVAVDVLALLLAMGRRPIPWKRGMGWAVWVGLIVGVAGALLAPGFTQAEFSDLVGWVDYAVLAAIGLGIGGAAALACLPLLWLGLPRKHSLL